MLRNLFRKNQECYHQNITPDMTAGYCAECGEYIENKWFITRCNCCGVKQQTMVIKGEIKPETKFCKNCGNKSFIVEKLGKINVIDVNYAVVVKQIVDTRKQNFFQTWVEKEVPIGLIPQKCL